MTSLILQTPLEELLGRLARFFENADVEEIYLQGESVGLWQSSLQAWTLREWVTPDWVRAVQVFAAEQWLRLDASRPIAGGRWDFAGEVYRWQCALPPVTATALFSLRRHRFAQLTLTDFGLPEGFLGAVRRNISEGLPLVVCGATGAGKSSLLLALLREFCLRERVLIVEDTRELSCLSPLWTALGPHQGVASLEDVFASVLRLRPQRIVIGELRGREGAVLEQAAHSGHGSVWTTVHAGLDQDLRVRLRQLNADGVAVVGALRVDVGWKTGEGRAVLRYGELGRG